MFDQNLSTPLGQSCVACHGAAVGFTGPISDLNAHGSVYPGAVHTRFGNRKPPASAYAGDSPVLHYDEDEGVWIGGMFWDGRATGWTLGDPLAEQALGPFLNPLEQNNPNSRTVVWKVARSNYAPLFREVWGESSLPLPRFPTLPGKALQPAAAAFDDELAYERIGRSIAAFERSNEVNPFSSKYDFFLAGMVELTPQESLGLALYDGGRCVRPAIRAHRGRTANRRYSPTSPTTTWACRGTRRIRSTACRPSGIPTERTSSISAWVAS
jgi:cytochrome c peroxidase